MEGGGQTSEIGKKEAARGNFNLFHLDKQGSSYIKLHLILTTAVIHV